MGKTLDMKVEVENIAPGMCPIFIQKWVRESGPA